MKVPTSQMLGFILPLFWKLQMFSKVILTFSLVLISFFTSFTALWMSSWMHFLEAQISSVFPLINLCLFLYSFYKFWKESKTESSVTYSFHFSLFSHFFPIFKPQEVGAEGEKALKCLLSQCKQVRGEGFLFSDFCFIALARTLHVLKLQEIKMKHV